MSDVRSTLDRLLGERILILDGATGTMIQRLRPRGGRLPRRALGRTSDAAAGNNDLLTLTRPDIVDRDPPRVPRGRRGHHRDQHLQRRPRWPGRLRHRAPGAGHQRRGRPPGPRRGGQWTARDPREAALRGRRASGRPTACCRSRPTWRIRPPAPITFDQSGRGVRGAGARPDRGRRRPAAGRDDHRRAWARRPRSSRSTRCAEETGTRLPVMISVTVTDRSGRTLAGQTHRGLLDHDRARAAVQRGSQLRPGRGRHAPLPGAPRARGQVLDELLPERRAAERLRRVRRDAGHDRGRAARSSPSAGWSTCSAAAAAPRPTTSAPSRPPRPGWSPGACPRPSR